MKKNLYVLFLIVFFLGCSCQLGPTETDNPYQEEYEENMLKLTQIKNELTNEVNFYIKKVAPTSDVSGDYLIDGCNNYDIDLIFVLAQGTLESHFATKGVGGKINSIFNVCVYDNIKSGNGVSSQYRYPHPDDSIEPYLQLLRDNYLVNGKTEKDLLANFVNKHGQRYASYPHYEKQMSSIIKRIQYTTKIDSLQQEYRAIEAILL